MENYKTYNHNPPHLFKDNSKYFITSSTYKKINHFNTDEAKEFLVDSIYKAFSRFNWIIDDWVILDNHYHIMVEAKDNADRLSGIIRNIHKFSAIWLKKNNSKARNSTKIWHNFWDTCISYEKSYFTRINYIWFNPVKHHYVDDPKDWKFGSYFYRYKDDPLLLKEIILQNPCDKLNLY